MIIVNLRCGSPDGRRGPCTYIPSKHPLVILHKYVQFDDRNNELLYPFMSGSMVPLRLVYFTICILPVLSGLVVSGVAALSPAFLSCQLQKPPGISPLRGCPPGTVFVSQDDKTAHFARVQDAVLSLYAVSSIDLFSRP